MAWYNKFFKSKEVEELKSYIGDIERNYENNINSLIMQMTYQQQGNDTPMYDLQNPEAVLNETILKNTDVLSVVEKIYGMAQNAELKLYQKEKDGSLAPYMGQNANHYQRFLRKPSSQVNFNEFLEGYFQFVLVLGNSFWNSVRYDKGAKKGLTSQLVIMYPQYTTVVMSGDPVFPVKGYRYSFGDQNKELEYNSVTHIKWHNPKYVYGGQYFGLSPMRVALPVVQKQNNITIQEKNQIGRGGPQGVLFKKNKEGVSMATATQQQDMKESFVKYNKEGRSDWPLVSFEIGKETLGNTASEMGLSESSMDGLRKICNVLSFPSVLMNDNASSTYNNVSEARKSAWTDCIIRHLENFAFGFTEAVITPEDIEQGVCFKWDYSKVSELSDDLNKVVDAMTKAKATPNELRQAVGLEPIDDDSMNVPYISFNEIPINEREDDNSNDSQS